MRQRRRTLTLTHNKKAKRSCKEKHKKCAALKQISVSFCSPPFFSSLFSISVCRLLLTKMGRTVQNKTSWQLHASAWQAPFKHSPLSAAVVSPAQLCFCPRIVNVGALCFDFIAIICPSLSFLLPLVLCGLAALFTLSLCCPDMFCVLLA